MLHVLFLCAHFRSFLRIYKAFLCWTFLEFSGIYKALFYVSSLREYSGSQSESRIVTSHGSRFLR